MADIVSKLVRECNAAWTKGVDFLTIWHTTLKQHPYVAGQPLQDQNEAGPALMIPLVTGRHLIFDASGFWLG
ncbi:MULTISPECIES: hypothetical protein [unclassified Mesorhizobium]|uniref:Uncharacterized protein n=1 Tax=Mesorhizobium salmacidum TaxID=3015171 RepID=A0ABU8L3L4_9HYPH|nr:hypothetical protein [Mesorhizobium sp. WSM3626]